MCWHGMWPTYPNPKLGHSYPAEQPYSNSQAPGTSSTAPLFFT
jgi:hypothetical protein